MRLTCYLRNGVVYIPTLGKVEAGFYQNIEPTAVVPVSRGLELKQALLDTMARGNPLVPIAPRGDVFTSPVLKYAGVKSWTAFAKGTISTSVDQKDGHYQIIGKKKRPDRGWEEDPAQTITLPADATLDDVCEQLISTLQAKAAQT